MSTERFILKKSHELPTNGKVSWESPSNIALVKYWGKYGEQLPKNPSVSFTLNNCKTTTTLLFEKKNDTTDFLLKFF